MPVELQNSEGTGSLRILLVGASGLLGANLWRSLEGHSEVEVIGLSRNSVMRQWVSLADYGSDTLRAVLDSLLPHVVINCVGLVGHLNVERNPSLAYTTNVSLPKDLARLTHQRAIHFVHFSSDAVYSGNPRDTPFAESSTPNPFTLYGEQKLESERVVQSMNPTALVLRVNFFGWSRLGDKGILDYFASHALAGTRPIGYDAYTVTSSSTSTVANAVIAAIDKGLSGVYNLASPDSMTKFAFGQKVFSMLGHDPARVVSGQPSAWSLEGVSERDLSMSSNLLEARLGLSLPPQLEDLESAVADLPQFLDYLGMGLHDPRLNLTSGTKK